MAALETQTRYINTNESGFDERLVPNISRGRGKSIDGDFDVDEKDSQ
jgi:hypothetical protein